MTSSPPSAPAPLLGEEALDAVLRVLVERPAAITVGQIGRSAEAVLAALEPLVAALVAERGQSVRADGANRPVAGAMTAELDPTEVAAMLAGAEGRRAEPAGVDDPVEIRRRVWAEAIAAALSRWNDDRDSLTVYGPKVRAVLAALEPLVAERERAAYERGHRDGVEDAP